MIAQNPLVLQDKNAKCEVFQKELLIRAFGQLFKNVLFICNLYLCFTRLVNGVTHSEIV